MNKQIGWLLPGWLLLGQLFIGWLPLRWLIWSNLIKILFNRQRFEVSYVLSLLIAFFSFQPTKVSYVLDYFVVFSFIYFLTSFIITLKNSFLVAC